jgi:protein-S-isoprenylcysteine O-methyltransferase Ste14
MAIYAFRQALNALSIAAMIFWDDPRRWSLNPKFVQVVGILSYSVMLWCAYRRYRLAKRNQPVPSMVREPRRPQPSLT